MCINQSWYQAPFCDIHHFDIIYPQSMIRQSSFYTISTYFLFYPLDNASLIYTYKSFWDMFQLGEGYRVGVGGMIHRTRIYR